MGCSAVGSQAAVVHPIRIPATPDVQEASKLREGQPKIIEEAQLKNEQHQRPQASGLVPPKEKLEVDTSQIVQSHSRKPMSAEKSQKSLCTSRRGKVGFNCSSRSRRGCELEGCANRNQDKNLTRNSSHVDGECSSSRLVRHLSETSRMLFMEPQQRLRSKFGQGDVHLEPNVLTLVPVKQKKNLVKTTSSKLGHHKLYRSRSKENTEDIRRLYVQSDGMKTSRMQRVGSQNNNSRDDLHDVRIETLMRIYGLAHAR